MIITHTKRFITKGILGIVILWTISITTTLADDFMYVTAYHLNVRSEGTFRSGVIATIDSGYKVVILEKLSNGWDKVLLENGQVGYVNARYLGRSEPYFEKAQGSEYEVSVPNAFVRGEGLQKKIAVLHRGDRLEVLDRKIFLQKWIRVRITTTQKEGYIGRTGYISKNIVQVVEGTEYPEEVPLLNSAPEEANTDGINDDWIGDGTSGATLNSAPEESFTGSSDSIEELLRSLWNTDAQINTGTVNTGSTDIGNLGDIFSGLLDDTGNSDIGTATPTPNGTGATLRGDTTPTTESSVDSLFGSLLE